MTATAILMIEKLNGPAFPLRAARHNRRTIQAELGAGGHIDHTRTPLNRTLAGPDTPEEVAKQAKELMRAAGVTKLRKDAVTALEAIFSIPERLVIDRDAYFARCLEWAADEFGGMGNILSADVHNDEAQPHLHVLVLPLREGRMNGSDMMGNRQTIDSRQKRFYKEVAGPFGFQKPLPRLTGAARADAVARVLGALNARNDPAFRSAGWQVIRTSIEKDPAPWMELLGLQVQERTKRLRSSTDIFISPGKGPKKEANPIGFAFSPSGNDRSLSCVGFAPDAADPEAANARDDRRLASAAPSTCASPAHTLAETAHGHPIMASAHQESLHAPTVPESTALAGGPAGCGLPCGSSDAPIRMETGSAEPAQQLRNPKVAQGGNNADARAVPSVESAESSTQVAYRLPTSGPETTKPRRASEAKSLILLVPEKGIEPSTFSLRMSCSTD